MINGKLVIISAPSGAGKTTIVRHLLESGLNLEFSVSATTRPKRAEETNGTDYYFLEISDFRDKIRRNEFIEWEEVYKDHLYGTLKSEVDRIWENGNHALFDVDVNGGISLKKIFGTKAISLFIMPPSIEELDKRLRKRGTESPDKVKMRIEKAKNELLLADVFDTVIINNRLDIAVAETINIVKSFLYT